MVELLVKRHGSAHYANLPYGFYAFAVILIYILVLVLVRKVFPNSSLKPRNSFYRKTIDASPMVHLPFLFICLGIPFIDHYSIFTNVAVYMKRLGRLSYVLVFLNVFLTLKPNYLLSDYIYIQLIPLHIWLSRIISAFGIVHGAGFILKWSLDDKVSLISKLIKNVWNLVGLITSLLIVLLLFASTAAMRRYSYKTFFVIHQLCQWSMCILVPIHARPGVAWPFSVCIACLYFYQFITDIKSSKTTDVLTKITNYKAGTNLVRVKLGRYVMPSNFSPGSHLRITCYRKFNPLYWILPSHPFTVASLPKDDEVELIVREHGRFKLELGTLYTVVNYSPGIPLEKLRNVKRVAIVVGGSGISLGLPTFRYIRDELNVDYLKFIWLVKNKGDLHVVEDKEGMDIYVTKAAIEPPCTETSDPPEHITTEYELEYVDDLDGEANQLDATGALISSIHTKSATSRMRFGTRIDWGVELSTFVTEAQNMNHLLVLCGPKTLVDEGEAYAMTNKIDFYKEVYSI
ncbi:HFL145Cp [Eremothecium sinecaudum]|uniref:Probable metalloreductase AIM14 n=1 Tax=Eremothecium sinecaudum TaxID=45286 RepID=A0A0X8HUH4_9SACH|nr:HFL145Cp [Eremothecium sinecaudum]AMD21711.1 HFL145Cp [Eremothecium sinecaudum]